MDTIESIITKLNLLYYEYDKTQHRFIVDKKANLEAKQKEFIKLTFYLSKNQIPFFIDDESNLILEKKDTTLSHLIQYIKNKIFHFKNEKKNIYILSDTPIEHAKNLPLIQTTPIQKEIDFSLYDAIIFTSKNGVKAIDAITKEWTKLPCYAISNKTAKTIKEHGGKIAFISEKKHGDEFATELIDKLQNKKVLFLGAKKVVANLVEILNINRVTCTHEPIYETSCIEYNEKVTLPKNSIIIFSSPSTIECFFKNINWDKSFKAISIGNTTAKYFPKDIIPIISDNTSLNSCVQKALSL